MAEGGTIELNFRARLDQLESDMARARSRVGSAADDMGDDANNRFGKKLGGIGKSIGAATMVGLAGAGAAAGAFLTSAIGGASDLAETLSKSNTIFGDQGKAMEMWASGAAKAFGQTKQGALDAAATFGNLFVQLGTGSGEAAKMSQEMVVLASDFASFSNAAPTEVIDAMTAAFRGEYDSVQRFVPTINAASVELKALEMGLATSTKELTEQDKVLATQALLMAGAGAAAGDFARTSDGLANRQRILSAQFSDMKDRIGTALLPVVLKLMEGFMGMGAIVDPLVAGFNVLTGVLGNPVFQVVAGIIAAALVPAMIMLGVQAAATGVAVVASYTVMAARAIAGTVTSVAQMAIQGAKWVWMGITALASAAQVAAAWLIALGPIALVVVAVIAAAVLIVKNWDWIKETVGNVVGAVVGFISRLIGAVVNFVQEWGVLLLGPIGAMWKFRDEISGVVSAVIGFFGRLASAVIEKAGDLISTVAGIPGRILGALGNVGALLWNAGWEIISGLGRGIMAGVQKVYDFVSGIAGKIASLKGPLSYDRRLLKPAGMAIMDGLVVGLKAHESQLVSQLAHITGLIAFDQQAGDVGGPVWMPQADGTNKLIGYSSPDVSSMGSYGSGATGPATGTTIIVQGSLVSEKELRTLGRDGTANITRYNGTPGF